MPAEPNHRWVDDTRLAIGYRRRTNRLTQTLLEGSWALEYASGLATMFGRRNERLEKMDGALLNEADPIWGEMPAIVYSWADGGRDVDCARSGGRYLVTGTALGRVRQLAPDQKARLTTWIVDRNRLAGDEPPIIDSDVLKRIIATRSMTPDQQMDRLLLYLAHRGLRPGEILTWLGPHTVDQDTKKAAQETLAWIEAHSDNELPGVRSMLVGDGLFRNDHDRISVAAAGFKRIEQLRRGAVAGDQVFIAMWFHDEVADADKAIEEAIVDAGFRPVRIDRKEHNNKIDDEIIAEIRRSKFVVADFTCGSVKAEDGVYLIHRGGVYYEAGFAQGLGIPVIWSVRSDQVGGIHFDTRQFNHIAWSSPAELKIRLLNRIRALFVEAA